MSNQFDPWTPEDDEVIRRLYPIGSHVAAEALPARTIDAVRQRAVRLGVKRVYVGAAQRSSRRARARPMSMNNLPAQTVEEWLASGGVIEHPQPKPFLRITPGPAKCRPLVMPMRVMGRSA